MSSKYTAQKTPAELGRGDAQQEGGRQPGNPASLGPTEALLTVEQVIEWAKEWVSEQAERFPGFLGAHLMGGIKAQP